MCAEKDRQVRQENAHGAGNSAAMKRPREDDLENLDESLAQQRLFEIDGPESKLCLTRKQQRGRS